MSQCYAQYRVRSAKQGNYPNRKTHIPTTQCSPIQETHIPSDMCSPTQETYIPSDMRSPTQETHTVKFRK